MVKTFEVKPAGGVVNALVSGTNYDLPLRKLKRSSWSTVSFACFVLFSFCFV